MFYPFAFNAATRRAFAAPADPGAGRFRGRDRRAGRANACGGRGGSLRRLAAPAGAAAYKITTAAEGIHRITREWLTAQGLGATEIDAIDLSQVRLYHLGVEQALEVSDANGNGRLDAGDFIGFYAAPVPEAYRKYARDNLYWLISGGGAGPLRMQTTAGAPAGGVLAASHECTHRHERDQLYLQSAPGADGLDRWIFSSSSIAGGPGCGDAQAGQPKSLTVTLPGALGSGDAHGAAVQPLRSLAHGDGRGQRGEGGRGCLERDRLR